MNTARAIRRRAFTLIEAVTVVLVLALAVPPAVSWLDEAVSARADSVNATRAAALAGAVIEHILADCSSTAAGLGFDALAAPSAYLDTPTTGLRARLAAVSDFYAALGFAYSVSIGPLVDDSASENPDSSLNVFRVVTVTVDFPSAAGGRLLFTISFMVSGSTE